MKKLFLILLLLPLLTKAQYINRDSTFRIKGTGSVNKHSETLPCASCALEIGDLNTNKAVLMPRASDTSSIGSPVEGMIIYSSVDHKFYFRNQYQWIAVGSSQISSVVELRNTISDIGQPTTIIILKGYYVEGDGGGGTFYWDATSTAADNGGTVIKPTSISGAGRWIRFAYQDIDIRFFGAKGDGVFDNRAILKTVIANSNNRKIFIPELNFRVFDSIHLTKQVEIYGVKDQSALTFPQGKSAFHLEFPYANETYFHDFIIESEVTVASTDLLTDGVISRVPMRMRNMRIQYFPGSGLNLWASVSLAANDYKYGNTSNSTFDNCFFYYNGRHGVDIWGDDASNMSFTNCDFRTNGACGVYDHGFLGNHFAWCHNASNSDRANNKSMVRFAFGDYYALMKDMPSFVTHSGTTYRCLVANVGIEPGVTSGWATYWVAQTAIPGLVYFHDWLVGNSYIPQIKPGTTGWQGYWAHMTHIEVDAFGYAWDSTAYHVNCGGYVLDNINGAGSCLGIYGEGGQPPNYFEGQNIAFSGDIANGWWYPNGVNDAQMRYLGSMYLRGGWSAKGTDALGAPYLMSMDGIGIGIKEGDESHGTFWQKWIYDSASKMFRVQYGNSSQWTSVQYPTFNTSPSVFGKSSALSSTNGADVAKPMVEKISFKTSSDNTYHHFGYTDSLHGPTGGEWSTRDFVMYVGSNPNVAGYRCIAGGWPGTWITVSTGEGKIFGVTDTIFSADRFIRGLHQIEFDSAAFLINSRGAFGTGAYLSGPLGTGVKMYFEPASASFRMGYCTGTLWDNPQNFSFAGGNEANASSGSFAWGNFARATGSPATAIGENVYATNSFSTAIGYYDTASGVTSIALGSNIKARAPVSIGIGAGHDLFEDHAIAIGTSNQALGSGLGANTISIGNSLITNQLQQIVIGQYNDSSGAIRKAFSIGRGSPITRRDIVYVDTGGYIYGKGLINSALVKFVMPPELTPDTVASRAWARSIFNFSGDTITFNLTNPLYAVNSTTAGIYKVTPTQGGYIGTGTDTMSGDKNFKHGSSDDYFSTTSGYASINKNGFVTLLIGQEQSGGNVGLRLSHDWGSGNSYIRGRESGGVHYPVTMQHDGGNVIIGMTTDNGGRIQITSGSATAGTAPLKIAVALTAPILNTSAEKYAIEADSTTGGGNIYYTNASATRYILAKTLTNTAVLDFPNTVAQANSDLTITVTGAVSGDPVVLGTPQGAVLANTCFTAWVSASNTVTVRFNNYWTGASDPASGTFRVSVLKY